MGTERAGRATLTGHALTVVAGFGGGIDPGVRPGDIVLAGELRTSRGPVACADPAALAGVLRQAGLRVRVGAIWSDGRLVVGAERRALQSTGAVAVDMESAALAARLAAPPVVLRVIVDTPTSELYRPWATLTHGLSAFATLRRVGGLLSRWTEASPAPPPARDEAPPPPRPGRGR